VKVGTVDAVGTTNFIATEAMGRVWCQKVLACRGKTMRMDVLASGATVVGI